MTTDALNLFSPAVAEWFRSHFGSPTPPQELGWPRIARGENTLILAPTGSGKTLAAFLWMLDELATRTTPEPTGRGVRAVYISPLRALASDVERNLEVPLEGIRACSEAMGLPVSDVRVAMRTGDTTPAERQRMLRVPPDLLITTPESLHLLVTARRSREILRQVRYVIVDEIHTMCDEKRGTFLALLLERLERLAGRPLVRIGLSATQRPLERVARFLGGYDAAGAPRPVAVVDCGGRKNLDLRVVAPVSDMRLLPTLDGDAPSVWPAIYRLLLDLTRTHRSTLIFANNRRAVERIAAEMNRLAGRRLVRAHHGSVAKEYRREIEGELKAGRLPALVATASLELGIDMGAIDLVCQIETPTSVASGLQRVGRAGHVVHAASVGRLIPKTRSDLLRMAGMARAMLRGEISAVRIPENPLDVLAQQLIAMAAAEDWTSADLFACVRQADPFHGLTRASFDAVLDMVAGGYQTPAFPGLRARVLWERASDRVTALPGALHAALAAGGTIPDTGQYAMVLEDGKTRLGELDEEFVFERRIGETFVLGTGRWKIVDIRHDRVVVAPSALEEAQLPFWKGEGLGHDAEFGVRLGVFVAECVTRQEAGDLEPWLVGECALDSAAAVILSEFVSEQVRAGGLPDDRTILVDVFPNESGDLRVAILSTLGRTFHLALWLALCAELREAGHEAPDGIVSNDGILLRPGSLEIGEITRALASLGDGRIRERLLDELHDSPYFALRFRRNAGRALLLPRSLPGRRVPLWLQRLRSHDLLNYASAHPRFPIVAETYREILEDALPVAELETFAGGLRDGETRFALRRAASPSPLAAALLLDFLGKVMYEADRPATRPTRADKHLLDDLLEPQGEPERIDEDALRTMDERLQGASAFHRARDRAEVVELLRRIGDLTDEELRVRCEAEAIAAIGELEREGRILRVRSRLFEGERWVGADHAPLYGAGGVLDNEAPLYGAGGVLDNEAPLYGGGGVLDNEAPLYGGGGVLDNEAPLYSGGGVSDNEAPLCGGGGVSDSEAPLYGGGGVLDNEAPLYGGGGVADSEAPLLGGGGVADSEAPLYGGGGVVGGRAKPSKMPDTADVAQIIARYTLAHAGRTLDEIRARYPGAGDAVDVAASDERFVRVDLPSRPGALMDREVLVGLRRMTLSVRRRSVSSVAPSALSEAVLRRQHITDPVQGSGGLRDVVGQLAGWLAPVAVWPEILEARVADFGKSRLDPLVRGGTIEWRGSRAGGTRMLCFAPAGTGSVVLPPPVGEPQGLAADVVSYLNARGASFLTQIAAGLGRPSAAVDEALWELTWNSWVTNDSLAAALRAGPGRVRPTPGVGRWSALPFSAEALRADDEALAARLRILLGRYGFLSRELLGRDGMGMRWSDAYQVLSRMEWRGEIERGLFVSGLSGLQFALPGVEAELRRVSAASSLRILHVMDPAFLSADIAPSERLPRRGPGNYVVLKGGEPILAVERRARRLVPLVDLSGAERRDGLALLARLVQRAGQRPSIRVEHWCDVPVTESEAAADLASLGFLRDDQAMVLYRRFGGSA